VEKAMALAMIFSERKEYTTDNPLKIQLEEGVHDIVGALDNKVLDVTCCHITFVGKGKDRTTMHGGVSVCNQQNVKFEELAVMNQRGYGLQLWGSETIVNVLKCAFKECRRTGMVVAGGATVTATQCEFVENDESGVHCQYANTKARLNDCKMHHNGFQGLITYDRAVVDLHGIKTDIHSNKDDGIHATGRGIVNIHLPSQHNTPHGNANGDRSQDEGGSIANINADGTFTHVVVVEEKDDDDY
jgi:hypothetical protein